jgi:hypothetical protein
VRSADAGTVSFSTTISGSIDCMASSVAISMVSDAGMDFRFGYINR